MKSGRREISLEVPAGEVWNVLVAPGPRDWYYRLTPDGEFVEGGRVLWRGGGGAAMEESDVVAVEAPRRIELRTRYLFDPNLAAQTPHLLRWGVEPDGAGSRAHIEWESGDQVAAMLEAESENMLLALRLAVDPAARAELARLDSIGETEIRDLTPERLSDYYQFFDDAAFRDYPAWRSCYCHETHRTQSDEESATRTAADNRSDMTELIRQGRVTALLAYAGGKPVGWCNYGETTALGGVMRRFDLQSADHESVGSISCFVIAAPYRRHRLASRLLDEAVERLRRRGMHAVEAYPARDDESPQANYRGPLSMFTRAGFAPYREIGRHVVVRKAL